MYVILYRIKPRGAWLAHSTLYKYRDAAEKAANASSSNREWQIKYIDIY